MKRSNEGAANNNNKQQRLEENDNNLYDHITASIRGMREALAEDGDTPSTESSAREFVHFVSMMNNLVVRRDDLEKVHKELRLMFDMGLKTTTAMESFIKSRELGGYLFLEKEDHTSTMIKWRDDDEEPDSERPASEVDARNFKYKSNAFRYVWKTILEECKTRRVDFAKCSELRPYKYTPHGSVHEYGPRDSSLSASCIDKFIEKHMEGVHIYDPVVIVQISEHEWEDDV